MKNASGNDIYGSTGASKNILKCIPHLVGVINLKLAIKIILHTT